jgi:AraC family transcriptional regulator
MSKNSDAVSDSRLQAGEFYGEVLNRRDCSGLVLSEVSYKIGRKLPEHSHQLAYFCLLIEGDYAEYHGSKSYQYKPLSIMFHPPGLEHRDEIGSQGGHFFTIELGLEWIERMEKYAPVPNTIMDLEGGDLAWLALRLFRELRSPHTCSPLAVEGLVMMMLAELGRTRATNERPAPRWLTHAINLLRAEFNQNLTIDRVASEVGIHPFHLSKVFRRFHQQTVGEYVKRLRVQFACRELLDPEIELASVALAAGFADQSHFTRAFREITGMTPGSFRIAIKTRRTMELLDYES